MTIKVIHLTPSDSNTGPVNVARDICSGLNKINVKAVLFNLRGTGRSNIFLSFITLFKILSKNNGVIVHSHGIIPDFFMYFLSKLLNVKWISTVHCDPEEDLKFIYPKTYKAIVFIWMCILNNAKKVIFLTNYIASKQDLKNKTVIHNSRELEREPFSYKKNSNVTVGFCGALIERKNILSLVKCFPKDEKYKLLIAGDGPLLADLKKTAELRCLLNIKFLGHQNDLNDFWGKIDILILPSFAEGVPLAAIESLSKNVPLILMDLKNYHGVFSRKESVFINGINDKSLIQAIDRIHNSYKEYSFSSGEAFTTNFNFDTWISSILSVYYSKD